MNRPIFAALLFIALFIIQSPSYAIDAIQNGESFATVRAKMNAAITNANTVAASSNNWDTAYTLSATNAQALATTTAQLSTLETTLDGKIDATHTGTVTINGAAISPSNLVFEVTGDAIDGVVYYRNGTINEHPAWAASATGSQVIYTNDQWEVTYTNTLYYSYPYDTATPPTANTTAWTQEGDAPIPDSITETGPLADFTAVNLYANNTSTAANSVINRAQLAAIGATNWLSQTVGTQGAYGFDGITTTFDENQLQLQVKHYTDDIYSEYAKLKLSPTASYLVYDDGGGGGGSINIDYEGIELSADPGLTMYAPVNISGSLAINGDEVITRNQSDERYIQTNHTGNVSIDGAVNVSGSLAVNGGFIDSLCFEPSFTIAVIPDTQGMADTGVSTDIIAAWIAENTNTCNIQAVLHVGDVVNDDTTTEWDNVSSSFTPLFNLGDVPFAIIPAVHDVRDYPSHGSVYDWTRIDDAFPSTLYTNKSWYGGQLESGELQFSWYKFEALGEEYGIIAMREIYYNSYPYTTAEWAWAAGVIEDNPDRKFILLTHALLMPDGDYNYALHMGDTPENRRCAEIAARLIRPYSNVIAAYCGHAVIYYDGGYGGDLAQAGVSNLKHVNAGGDSGCNIVIQNFQEVSDLGYGAGEVPLIRLSTVYPKSNRVVHKIVDCASGEFVDVKTEEYGSFTLGAEWVPDPPVENLLSDLSISGDELVYDYDFANSTTNTFYDRSGNQRHLTLTAGSVEILPGGTVRVDSNITHAVSSAVSFPTVPDEYTLYIRGSSLGNASVIGGSDTSYSANFSFLRFRDNSRLQFSGGDGSAAMFGDVLPYVYDLEAVDKFICAVVRSTNALIYVDGVFVSEESFTDTRSDDFSTYVTRSFFNNTSTALSGPSYVSRLGRFNRALTDDEIYKLSNGAAIAGTRAAPYEPLNDAISRKGLSAYFDLSELDSSGATNNYLGYTSANGPNLLKVASSLPTQGTDGATFAGDGTDLLETDVALVDDGSVTGFTILVDYTPLEVSAARLVVASVRDGSSNNGWYLVEDTGGFSALGLYADAGNNMFPKATVASVVGERKVVAAKYDPATGYCVLYRDGIPVAMMREQLTGSLTSNQPLSIAGRSSGDALECTIHKVALYRRVLSDAEISALSAHWSVANTGK